MLIGNHDMHYMDEKFGRCSGWNPLTCSLANYLLCRDWNANILSICFIDEVNKTIYSHAGVSKNWCEKFSINYLGHINDLATQYFIFTYSAGGDYYGSSSYNGPLWIRPEGLKKSPYFEINEDTKEEIVWNQVFGHTALNAPIHWKDERGGEFYGMDCLSEAYLVENLDKKKVLIDRHIEYIENEVS